MFLEKDQIIQVEITDLGESGEGVGRFEDTAIFVEGGIVGDVVKVKINAVKKNYATGKAVKIIKSSDYRTEPVCPYFKKCSGCQIMNMDYKTGQLVYKEQVVREALANVGGFENAPVNAILGMETTFRYRNKGQYAIYQNKNGMKIGFSEKGSPILIDIQDCILQREIHVIINQIIREYIMEFNVTVYDETTQKGLLRYVMIRDSDVLGDVMVVLVINGERLIREGVLRERLLEAVPEIKSLIINENTLKDNRGLGAKNRVLFGSETIEDQIGNMTFKISPQTAFPINPEQTEVLYLKALEYANLSADESVYAISSSASNMTLFLEGNGSTLLRADQVSAGAKVDVVFIEPPKKGCDGKALDAILAAAPKRIIYVSCKPSTMARDLKTLCDSSAYQLMEVQPVDLMPEMAQADCVAWLLKVSQND